MAGTTVREDAMWVVGGWRLVNGTEHQIFNDVWRSRDGMEWRLVLAEAPWQARCYHSVVSFQGYIWIFGGYIVKPPTNVLGDVWRSRDGIEWEQVTADAPWEDREHMGCVVFKDKVYLLGGVTYGPPFHCFRDVWRMDAQGRWERVTEMAPWGPRRGFGCFVHQGRIWVVAGADSDGSLYNDAWASPDGLHWELVRDHCPWRPRVTACAVASGGLTWMVGGGVKPKEVAGSQDAWFSTNGQDWHPDTFPGPKRAGCIALAQTGEARGLYVFGGLDTQAGEVVFYQDAWCRRHY